MTRWFGRLRLTLAWEPVGWRGSRVLGWRSVPLGAPHARLVEVRLGVLCLLAKLYRPGQTYEWLAYQARGDAGEEAGE